MSLPTNAIDVSDYQHPSAMDWDTLRRPIDQGGAGLELAIVKASQALTVDPSFAAHYANAHNAGLIVAAYHFLGPSDNGEHEAEHFLRTVGDRWSDRRTFALVDWENNSATGETAAPMTAVRNFCNTIDRELGANRVGWYSYRSLAALHRDSLPWPLWLSDPSDNAEDWAAYLGAVIVQTGQTTELPAHPFTILTDSIYNREIFNQLTGEQTVITKEDAQLIVLELAAAFGLPVTIDPTTKQPVWPIMVNLINDKLDGYAPFPYGSVAPFSHEESKRGKLAAQSAVTNSARAADNAGTCATLAAKIVELLNANAVGMTPKQLADAMLTALQQVAPFVRVAIAAP